MHKQVSQPFPNIVSASMTGTSVITSLVTNIIHRDTVSFQWIWTGSPVGNFNVQGCHDYKPFLAQTEGYGAPNNGTWVSLPLQNRLTGAIAINQPTSLGSPILVNLEQLGFPWIQVIYTNISGSGTLNGFVTAKSLG